MPAKFSSRSTLSFEERSHPSLLALGLRLRPTLILASRVLPSIPPLFQNVE